MYWNQISFPIWKTWIYRLYVESTLDKRRKASLSLFSYIWQDIDPWLSFIISTTRESLPTIISTIPKEKLWSNISRELEWPQKVQQQSESWKWTNFLIRFPGKYTINSSTKKDDGSILAVARKEFTVRYSNFNPYNIDINNLISKEWQIVDITMKSPNYRERKVNRWDGKLTTVNNISNQTHSYSKKGIYTIQSEIVLQNGEKINEIKTISIQSRESLWKADRILNIDIKKLKSTVNDRMLFSLNRIWYNDNNIITRYLNDWLHTVYENKYIYSSAGIYYPTIYESIWVCEATSRQWTIVIQWSKKYTCLEMLLYNIPPISDIDGDGIDDICDDDIDGDWTKNIIWFIDYTEEYLNNRLLTWFSEKYKTNKDLFDSHFTWSCSLDNCPFSINWDQKDSNWDWIWDQCTEWHNNIIKFDSEYNPWSTTISWSTTQTWSIIDTDQDGIIDIYDQCPFVKENINGYQDEDGCPEVGNDNICEWTIIWGPTITTECIMCPCQYVNQSSDILPGDIIRTSLWSLTGNILQSRSTEYSISN